VRYHIWTVGCQMNKADSQKLAAGLDRLGWNEVPAPAEADLVVLNTCSVRDHAEQRAISKLGTLKKMRGRGKQFTIAVMGCMVGLKTDDLRRRFPFVDATTSPARPTSPASCARSMTSRASRACAFSRRTRRT
jgi:tRNA-2-methylthio-N6-dimethylallyladenosine synthase